MEAPQMSAFLEKQVTENRAQFSQKRWLRPARSRSNSFVVERMKGKMSSFLIKGESEDEYSVYRFVKRL